MKLHADVFCPICLQEARRLVAIKSDIAVGAIVTDGNIVLFGKLDDVIKEIEVGDSAGLTGTPAWRSMAAVQTLQVANRWKVSRDA